MYRFTERRYIRETRPPHHSPPVLGTNSETNLMGLLSVFRRNQSDVPTADAQALTVGEVRQFAGMGFDVFNGPIGLFDAVGVSDDVVVTPENALTASAVYSAVSVIASAIATLPVHVRDKSTQEIVTDHPVTRVLDNPNPEMTRSDALEALALNLLTFGAGFQLAQFDRSGSPTQLWPLRSGQTYPKRTDGRLAYHTPNGMLRPSRVVHAKNMSWDGICAISPLSAGAGAVGLALSLDTFARKFFSNGANIGNVVELPNMKPAALQEFKRLWKEQYEGVKNAHRTAAAPGLKVHKMGYSPKDSQAVESRLYQLREVARIYQIPPHMIGDLEKTTVGNIEEQSRSFAQYTLRRWLVKIEQAYEKTLLVGDDRDRFSIRFNISALVRGTMKDQIEALSTATAGAPIYTQNEARDYLGLPAVPGGDKLLSNLNQAPADTRDDQVPAETRDGLLEQRDALLQSIATNFATKEANALGRACRKHADDPEEMRAWIDAFYAGQREALATALGGDSEPLGRYIEERRKAAAEIAAQPDLHEIRTTIEASTLALIRMATTAEASNNHSPAQAA